MTDTILQELNLLQSQGGGGGLLISTYRSNTQWDRTQIQIHNVLHMG